MTRLLIVEDEERIVSFLVKGLRAQGYATDVATTGGEGLALARSGSFDLVILDLGLPDRDGFSVLRELRAHDRRLPVLILTARDDVYDTVTGFEEGANDYVTKPFRFDELLARIRARLRDSGLPADITTLEVGDLALDLRTRRARVGERWVELSAREFALAEYFFRHPGEVLSREQILSSIWGYDFDPLSNVVDVYIGYLRKKLGLGVITSVRGMGFRLEKSRKPGTE
ncbi:MAG: response regulator transcription factor [Actinobacteria bacterium]|nr:response regulator transcription factor [Actinomycetota bacterium]